MTPRRSTSEQGFSLVEMLVAVAIAIAITSAVFAMLDPAGAAFQTQPEAADVRQRLRASADALFGDIVAAGSASAMSPLLDWPLSAVPALFPMRIGRRGPDPAGSFSDSRIALWYANHSSAWTTLAAPLSSADGSATIAIGPACPAGDASCGFRSGMSVAVFDRAGAWDLFSVIGVAGPVLSLQHNLRDGPAIYVPVDTVIADVTVRTYMSKGDPVGGMTQLVRYDGAGAADLPAVDHLAALQFEYFGDAQPPVAIVDPVASEAVRATYGPSPPALGSTPTAYPAGENCVFARTAQGAVVSRLAALAGGPTLVPLSASLLTDGPWCPDASSPNRYDADLLRIRAVGVTVRVEAAITALRGPAGPLFTRAGTASRSRFVPDREVHLLVAPRARGGGQ